MLLCRPLQGAHEYYLRSKTVICDSCGQPSERDTSCGGGGLPEGMLGHTFIVGNNQRSRQVADDSFLTYFTFFLLYFNVVYCALQYSTVMYVDILLYFSVLFLTVL